MLRKIVSTLALLCFLAMGSSAFGFGWNTTVVWHNTNANQDWNDVGNWVHNGGQPDGIIPPDNNTFVVIEPYPGPIINVSGACSALSVCHWSWSGAPNTAVEVNGDFNAGGLIWLASNGGDFAYGDTNTVGTAGLTVRSGTVTTPYSVAGNGLFIGGGSNGYSLMNRGVVTMYGGLISVPRVALYHGNIALYGGTLECTAESNFTFYQDYPENKIDISGGKLKLAGDHTIIEPTLPNLIASGRIYSARGTLGAADYNSTTGYTTVVASDINMAVTWGPSPINGATNVHYRDRVTTNNVGVTLTWNDGEPNVINHQVYFGATSALVTAATKLSAEFRGEVNEVNVEPNSFVIGDINHPFTFAINTPYYWRVDANVLIDDVNTAIVKGKVWSFTTHNGKGYNPKPRDAQVGLNEPMALTWTSGDFAASTNGHLVYVGTDAATVQSATSTTAKVYRGIQTGTSYSLSNLATGWYSTALVPNTIYYWRVTEVNGATKWGEGISSGPVTWSFTPTGVITIDDFEDYNSTADLAANWGMHYAIPVCDFNALGFVHTPMSIPATSGTLSFVMDGQGKHGNYFYNALPFSEVRRNYPGGSIFTGSSVLSIQPAALRVDYVGAAINGVDELYNRMYVALEDTAGNVAVYNNPDGNAALVTSWTQWYSSLKDINAAGYPNVVKLASVNNFYLGFGLRCLLSNDQGTGGDGNVMFDNIRLYAQTCNPSVTLAADLDGDCDVDINDLMSFSAYWLSAAQPITFDTITEPCAPILWYKFNDSGNTTNVVDYGTGDTNNYAGTVNRWSAFNWDATGGRNGGPCLYIPPIPTAGGGAANAQTYVEAAPASVGFMGDVNHSADGGGVTFAVWANASMVGDFLVQYPGIWGVWNPANTAETVEVPTPSRLTAGAATAQSGFYAYNGGHGNVQVYRPLLDFGGRWNHWAWVKANSNVNGPYGSARIYCNGVMIGAQDANGQTGDPNVAATGPLFPMPAASVRIGTRGTNWAMWSGKLADFQIYDYALTGPEVAYLATDGTGTRLLPLVTRANLKPSGVPATEIVDFQDLSVMGDQWHQIQLWP